jgi:anti-sigma-K factor RskA
LGFVVFGALQATKPTPGYIVVLESADRSLAFVAAADPKTGVLSVRRLGPPPPAGRSFELWAIRDGAPPQTLGVVGASAIVPKDKLAKGTGGAPLSNILLAITEEQAGGTPDGKPTGAPLFTGKFVQAPEL